jgi:hypothetical protein
MAAGKKLQAVAEPKFWRSSYRELTTPQSYWQCNGDLVSNCTPLIDQHLRSNPGSSAIAGIWRRARGSLHHMD